MKKAIVSVFVFLLCLSLFACSDVDVVSDKGFWGRSFSIKDNNVEVMEEASEVTVENTELDNEIYDDGYITVTATGLSYEEACGVVLSFEADNFSEHNIFVESVLVAVNGCVFPATFCAEVPACESAEGVLNLNENELKSLRITSICKIEIKLNITDTETAESIGVSELASVYNNAVGGSSNALGGEEILSNNGVTVYIENTNIKDDEACDYVAGVFVGNISDKNICVSAENVTVNGVKITASWSINAAANKSAYQELFFYKSILEENGIENIEEIIMHFNVYDADTHEKIIDSEEFMITISDY